MKPALALSFALFVFAATSHAQNATAAQTEAHNQAESPAQATSSVPQVNLYMPGCGPGNENFDLKTEPNISQPDPAPTPGKALVYFVQDDRYFLSRPRPTVKWGVDGSWIGATRSLTYFHIAVDPGEHHLCAQWQSAVILSESKQTAVAHFVAEPGRVYYFRASKFVLARPRFFDGVRHPGAGRQRRRSATRLAIGLQRRYAQKIILFAKLSPHFRRAPHRQKAARDKF